MLEVDSIAVNFGAVVAVKDVSLRLRAGAVGALLGANGAGKSSLLGAISGLVRTSKGTITFHGSEIQGMKCYKRKGRGIVHGLEGHRVFGDLTVQENLVLGALSPGSHKIERRSLQAALEREYERFPVLGDRRRQKAGLLSGGEQQMLTISSTLMSDPKLLLLDEPSLGLSPKMATIIFATIEQLARDGLAILLVEQTVDRALDVADTVWVLRQGLVVREGTPQEIAAAGDIGELYLGTG